MFPRSTTPPRRPRRAMSAASPLVNPEAQRATGGKGMVMCRHLQRNSGAGFPTRRNEGAKARFRWRSPVDRGELEPPTSLPQA